MYLPKVTGDKSPLSPYLPPGLGCVNQFSLVLASSSSIANEAYPRSINMNHDRLTLYYRTISHFLLDLLNPTGTGVGAAAPLTTWLQHKKAGFGRTKTRQGQRSKITDNMYTCKISTYIILHLYHVLLTKCTAVPQ